MRNSLARKVTADTSTGTEAATPAQGTAASSAASPVHALQERLWEEFDPSRERIVLASFSNKQPAKIESLHRLRAPALILVGGIGGWALFFAGSVLGLY